MRLNGNYAFIAVVATGLVLAGCSKPVQKEKPATKVYSPLVTENTLMVVYEEPGKLYDSEFKKDFLNILEQKAKDYKDGVLEVLPKSLPENLEKWSSMGRKESTKKLLGIELDEIKWQLCAVEKFSIPDDIENEGIDCPRFYAVICSDKRVDIDLFVKNYGDIISSAFNAEPGLSNQIDRVKGAFKTDRSADGDTVTYKFSLALPEFAEKLRGLEPVLTTIEDGHLMVFASSDAVLADVQSLYSGTIPAAADDSAIMKELSIPDEVIQRVSIPEIGSFLRSVVPSNILDAAYSNEDAGEYAKSVEGLRCDFGIDEMAASMFFRIAVDFGDVKTVTELADMATAGINTIAGLVQMLTANQPDLAFVPKLINNIKCGASDKTFAIGLGITKADLSEISFKRIGKLAAEAQQAAKAAKEPAETEDVDDVFSE